MGAEVKGDMDSRGDGNTKLFHDNCPQNEEFIRIRMNNNWL